MALQVTWSAASGELRIFVDGVLAKTVSDPVELILLRQEILKAELYSAAADR